MTGEIIKPSSRPRLGRNSVLVLVIGFISGTCRSVSAVDFDSTNFNKYTCTQLIAAVEKEMLAACKKDSGCKHDAINSAKGERKAIIHPELDKGQNFTTGILPAWAGGSVRIGEPSSSPYVKVDGNVKVDGRRDKALCKGDVVISQTRSFSEAELPRTTALDEMKKKYGEAKTIGPEPVKGAGESYTVLGQGFFRPWEAIAYSIMQTPNLEIIVKWECSQKGQGAFSPYTCLPHDNFEVIYTLKSAVSAHLELLDLERKQAADSWAAAQAKKKISDEAERIRAEAATKKAASGL